MLDPLNLGTTDKDLMPLEADDDSFFDDIRPTDASSIIWKDRPVNNEGEDDNSDLSDQTWR
ncbi:hypothetical protein CVT26_010327 [Gymnopilus dilepis]|uniref:Uncharacterized protein n=1 Tax=Gymnopilus dilepis TaxID=231916 RepID=A0A409Y0X4_9AGAR|nr:hypothetical protein CVT26_010327 [Gymnopilus dilepis]